MIGEMLAYTEEDFIADPHRLVTVRRIWRDRLLSWPWRPWVATEQRPDPMIYKIAGQRFRYVAHPETIARYKRIRYGYRTY